MLVGFSVPSFAGKKICKLAHVSSTSSVMHEISMTFKREVEKAALNVEVQVYPAGQLGGTVAMMQGLQLDTVQIYPEFTFIWEGIVPEFKVWAVHYKFDSSAEAEKFARSPLHKQMVDKLVKKANVRIIGNVDAGAFTFLSTKAIRSIQDVKGLRNRVAQMAPLMESWRAYGAKPTPLDWGEVYISMATGVIDGLDNPMLDMYAEKFHEVSKYLNYTNNLFNVFSFNTSENFWKKLTDSEKSAFKNAIVIANEAGKIWVDKQWGLIEKEMKSKGVEFVQTNLAGFPESIQKNISTILGNDKQAIEVYKKIMARDYSAM